MGVTLEGPGTSQASMTSESNSTHSMSVRILRPSIVVLCGPAACGKSTFAARHFRPTQIISSDWARACVCDDDRDQRFNAQAFALVHFLIEQRLTLNRLCVVDSTALTAPARKELLELAKRFQVPAVALLFDVPLDTCVERDEKRERSVGRIVIERHHQGFELTKAVIREEGFDQVLELQDGDLDKVQIDILFRPVARQAPRPQGPGAGAARPKERAVSPLGPTSVAPRTAPAPQRAVAMVPPAPSAVDASTTPMPTNAASPAPATRVPAPTAAKPAAPSPDTAQPVSTVETR